MSSLQVRILHTALVRVQGTTSHGCWSKSKIGKQHPYYLCHSKNCTSYRKSIRRDVLEGKFSDTLRALQPTESLFDTAKATFKDIWTQRQAQIGSMRSQLNQEAAEIDQ